MKLRTNVTHLSTSNLLTNKILLVKNQLPKLSSESNQRIKIQTYSQFCFSSMVIVVPGKFLEDSSEATNSMATCLGRAYASRGLCGGALSPLSLALSNGSRASAPPWPLLQIQRLRWRCLAVPASDLTLVFRAPSCRASPRPSATSLRSAAHGRSSSTWAPCPDLTHHPTKSKHRLTMLPWNPTRSDLDCCYWTLVVVVGEQAWRITATMETTRRRTDRDSHTRDPSMSPWS